MNKFINEDKTVITLPVPLGSTLYTVGTVWQQKRFSELYSPLKESQDRRDHMEPRDWDIDKISFTFAIMPYVFKNWGTWVFATEEEAKLRSKEVKEKIRMDMVEQGFIIRKDGSYTLFGDWDHNVLEHEYQVIDVEKADGEVCKCVWLEDATVDIGDKVAVWISPYVYEYGRVVKKVILSVRTLHKIKNLRQAYRKDVEDGR